MTKIEAIEQLIKENGGCVSLKTIYDKIESFYHDAKKSNEWEAGLRGVLYRELKVGKTRRMALERALSIDDRLILILLYYF